MEPTDDGVQAGTRQGKPAATVHPLPREEVGKGTRTSLGKGARDPVLSTTELIMKTAARDSVTLVAHDLVNRRIGWWKAKQRLAEIRKA